MKWYLPAFCCLGLAAAVMAGDVTSLLSPGVGYIEARYSSAVTVAGSSAVVSGQPLEYSVWAKGGDVQFSIKQSTCNSGCALNESSTTYVDKGQTIGGLFRTLTYNLTILISSLPAGATAQVDVVYLKPTR